MFIVYMVIANEDEKIIWILDINLFLKNKGVTQTFL